MAVTLNKANLVLKDANGNIGKIEQLSSNDLAKIKTAVSDVALVVNQSNHTPIEATTTNKGVVQLATSTDVASGAIDKVVTAEQLHNSTTGTSALATENLARIDAVVTEAGIPIDHTNTNQLKTAVTTLINNATPATATANTLGVVKPDNDTITIDSNGVLTAIKASQDKNGAQIDTTYLPLSGGKMSGNITRNADNSTLSICGGTNIDKSATLHLNGKDRADYSGEFHLVTSNGTNKYRLKGAPNGTLTWNEKNIVRSVNGVNADDNGNVKLQGGTGGAITGKIEWFAFNTAPDGYLVCNGANVSRETYADLFAVIGTTFGSGDGSTTFALPNLIDKFAQGSTTVGTVKSAGLPNITGALFPAALNVNGSGGYMLECSPHGAFSSVSNTLAFKVTNLEYVANRNVGCDLNASRSNSTYGNSETVQPPALTLLPCIKY